MNPNLINFKVTPSIVEADKECEIKIESFDGIFRLFDDLTYDISFTPMEESDVDLDEALGLKSRDKNRNSISVKPQNGIITIKYFFKDEQEWRIHISTKDYGDHINPLYEKYEPHWHNLLTNHTRGVTLSIYSLKPDLYSRRALRGDLHIHTSRSDGHESPQLTAANYRKAGYDFIALTDHHMFDSAKFAWEKIDYNTDMEILKAEEIHNGVAGFFHMVNIGGSYSVSDIYFNEPERVKKEAAELEKSVSVPEGFNKNEYLNRVWLYNEIKKSGGYAIYPHPYWDIGFYHTETSMSWAILNNHLCDAFEILGGVTPEGNNLQVEFYNMLKASGKKVPIVGSTDSHGTFTRDSYFQDASTIAFCENKDVIKGIDEGYSVAVQSLENETFRVYGDFRLVKYTHFLLRNYFPIHNELCFNSGSYMADYVLGKENDKDLAEKLERRINLFENEFFGR